MTDSARTLLATVRRELAPAEQDNRLVPLVEQGQATRAVFGTIAAEELRIVTSDWRSFLTLASRAGEPTGREFFSSLALGEQVALSKVDDLATAAGMDDTAIRAYDPLPGCQAYPAYLAWLALNAEPAEAVVAVVANFAAWGDYCRRIAQAMREHYGFDDRACGFFDLFAAPPPGVEDQAVAAVQTGIDGGRCSQRAARQYGKLFQSYELMFWNTLADKAG